MKTLYILLSLLLILPGFLQEPGKDYDLYLPAGFPSPDIPPDNLLSPERVGLGKMLFYDPILSLDNSLSCASCHLPQYAFSDTLAFSRGVDGRKGTRNAPSLANVAYHPRLLKDAGVPSLEMQILVPIQEHVEFDFNILDIAKRLQQDSVYLRMSAAAYDRPPDAFVITRAIAAFERTLISGDAAYDQYQAGDTAALSESAVRGLQLFESDRLGCRNCHSGFNFTNYSLQNTGLYLNYADSGRARVTEFPDDQALFKVPSLRNVALTAPYMHDGSLADLSAVIDHFASGGLGHPNQSPLLKPFILNRQEKSDLIAFLESLTDHAFLQRQRP